DEQLLAKLRGAGDRLAGVVDDARVAVEHELVLTAEEPAERDAREVVARALREHPLPLQALARRVRRGGDVDDQGRPRERLLARRGARLPDVLTDGQPDRLLADLDHRSRRAGLEV